MASVHCLPDETLLKIFSFLSAVDVSQRVANVCTRWKSLACDTILWADLRLVVHQENELQSVLNLLPHLRKLGCIILLWRSDSAVIIRELCKSCPNLFGVNFFCCGFVKEESLKEISECYENLKYLSLEKCYCVEYKCINSISLLKNLITLNLSHCPLTPEQFRSISTSCTKITSLNIDNIRGISEQNLVFFLSLSKAQLISLTVFGELLTDNGFQQIGLCSRLNTLQISNCCNLSEKCFEVIYTLKSIHSLTLKKFIDMPLTPLSNFFFSSDLNNNISYLYVSTKPNRHNEGQVINEYFSIWIRNNVRMREPQTVQRLKRTLNPSCITVLKRHCFNYLIVNY